MRATLLQGTMRKNSRWRNLAMTSTSAIYAVSSYIQCHIVLDLQTHLLEHFLPNLDVIDEQEISQSLESFAFGRDSFSMDDSALFRNSQPTHVDVDDDDDENDGFGYDQDFGHTMDVDGISPSAAGEDFFIGDQAVPDEFNADFGADFAGDGDTASVNGSEGAQGDSRPSGPFVPFDPRRVPNEREMVMAINEDGEGMMNYFDPSYLKNWAGPEHWKLRKVIRRRKSSSTSRSAFCSGHRRSFQPMSRTPQRRGQNGRRRKHLRSTS